MKKGTDAKLTQIMEKDSNHSAQRGPPLLQKKKTKRKRGSQALASLNDSETHINLEQQSLKKNEGKKDEGQPAVKKRGRPRLVKKKQNEEEQTTVETGTVPPEDFRITTAGAKIFSPPHEDVGSKGSDSDDNEGDLMEPIEFINEFPRGVMPAKKGSSTFYCADDVQFLRIVLHERPFLAGYGQTNKKWEAVAASVRDYAKSSHPLKEHLMNVTTRGCRSHFDCLLGRHREEELVSRYSSGTNEEYGEIKAMLTEINETMFDAEIGKKELKSSAQSKEETLRYDALQIRMNALKDSAASSRSSDDISVASSPENGLLPKKRRKVEYDARASMQIAIANYFNAKAEEIRSNLNKK